MANTAYVCRLRTDIPAGTLQLLDLQPNTSSRNLTLEPVGQSGYLGDRVENDTLAALTGGTDTAAVYKGLAAYLIDNVIDGTSNVTITVTVANDGAAGLIALLDAGSALTEAAINADLIATGGAGAGTDINANSSSGSVKDILKIMSGGKYTLPSGSTVGGLSAAAELGSFDDDAYRQLYGTSALQISCGSGRIATFAAAAFSYSGTAGAALVVYDHAGNVLSA